MFWYVFKDLWNAEAYFWSHTRIHDGYVNSGDCPYSTALWNLSWSSFLSVAFLLLLWLPLTCRTSYSSTPSQSRHGAGSWQFAGHPIVSNGALSCHHVPTWHFPTDNIMDSPTSLTEDPKEILIWFNFWHWLLSVDLSYKPWNLVLHLSTFLFYLVVHLTVLLFLKLL